jgi:predicted O-methyltransferase YrrM
MRKSHAGMGSNAGHGPALEAGIPPAPWRQMPVLSRILLNRHRTPRYLWNRTREMAHHRIHPDDPWLTPAAVRLLGTLLRPSDLGFEFGSGRSTLWFARRVAALTSMEHDEDWHAHISARLKANGLANVDYVLAPGDLPADRGGESEYARSALSLSDASLDFALIDGKYRDYSAKFTLPKIKPGGLLIIDNVNWYLPCRSKAPNSRSARLGPKTSVWAEVADELAAWRTIWTTSGVTDTAIFIRPGEASSTMKGSLQHNRSAW